MFNINKPATNAALNDAIDLATRELAGHEPHTEQYAAVVDQLTKLYALKAEDKPSRVSKDVLVTAAANLGGILVIVAYEQRHVMASKALSFVGKVK